MAMRKRSRGPDYDPYQNRQSRRLYIGNLPASATDDQVLMLINDALRHSRAWDGRPPAPASGCFLRSGYCFVEFTTPEAAAKALELDGMQFGAYPLKVRRPREYSQSDAPPPPPHYHSSSSSSSSSSSLYGQPPAHHRALGSAVPDSPHKIFIGGIPAQLSEDDVQAILQPFGPLHAFNLVRDPVTRSSRGFAFCEFQDVGVTDHVCRTLNGQKLHDKTLVVQRAQQHNSNTSDRGPALVASSDKHAVDEGEIVRSLLTLSVPMQDLMTSVSYLASMLRVESRVVLFLNMASVESLRDDAFYHDLVVDVHEVCSAFGKVCSIVIPRITNTNSGKHRPPPGSIGRVYVEFADLSAASTALIHLGGTLYDGRKIIALYHHESIVR